MSTFYADERIPSWCGWSRFDHANEGCNKIIADTATQPRCSMCQYYLWDGKKEASDA